MARLHAPLRIFVQLRASSDSSFSVGCARGTTKMRSDRVNNPSRLCTRLNNARCKLNFFCVYIRTWLNIASQCRSEFSKVLQVLEMKSFKKYFKYQVLEIKSFKQDFKYQVLEILFSTSSIRVLEIQSFEKDFKYQVLEILFSSSSI